MNKHVPSVWTFQYCIALFFSFYDCWTHGQAFKMFVSCVQEKRLIESRRMFLLYKNRFISCHSQSTFLKLFIDVPLIKRRPFGISEKTCEA